MLQQTRLASAFVVHPDHAAVEVVYQCAQDLRDVFHQPTPTQGSRLAKHLITALPSCPIPEIARLGKTLRRRRTASLAYFDTDATARATAAPRPSTDSSNPVAASPAASTTSSTTASERSSSREATTPHPTLSPGEPDYGVSVNLQRRGSTVWVVLNMWMFRLPLYA